MPNGSLENHLYPSHSSSHGLDLAQLVSIFSDVAEGVAYLHHHSPVRVVHCDLKPSNILLDPDLTALVTDYGLLGDVYSFGVLLLEIVTRKRPTNVLFHEGSSLHEWVKSHYPHKLEPVVEAALERCSPRATQVYDKRVWCDVVLELIDLGLICTQFNPSTSPTMSDIAQEMARLKTLSL
ncbi:leucine-rich receptor-like protein kinase family protein [Actinidia rufa]|uniref:Leucine-rich receptor-like protein kinase family protein n=1 Tax=Actinidia rufa TaxID=165716 RepID=A0A7J0E3M6_9ERIC|nr:leucine-rich receptor-like protein kinase family protein [Actinidia rufa]